VDPHKFDGIIRQLSQIRSRRALVGGSLGAAVLAAIGVGEEAVGKQVDAEHKRCLATGKRCGYTQKKKNGKNVRRPCTRCCQHHSVERPDGKRECACIPTRPDDGLGIRCQSDTQCCSGFCGDNVCHGRPCAQIGEGCDHRGNGSRCCPGTGRCNQTGDAPGTCVQCLGTGAPCDPLGQPPVLCCEACVPNGEDPAAGGTCGPVVIST
jgi:hypothetical protein